MVFGEEGQKNLHDSKERTVVTVIVLVLIVGIPAGLFLAGMYSTAAGPELVQK